MICEHCTDDACSCARWMRLAEVNAQLRDQLAAVRALHPIYGEPEDWMDDDEKADCRPICGWCSYDDRAVPWPCPTLLALPPSVPDTEETPHD